MLRFGRYTLSNFGMNILIFSWRGPGHPNAGGAEISTHEHAKGWIKFGHQVTLFTSYYKGAKKDEIIDGVKIIRSGRQFLGVQVEAFKWYLFGNHPEYDLVVDQFHGIPFFTILYVRTKILSFIHEVAKEVWVLNPGSKMFFRISGILGMLLEPYVFKIFYRNIPFMTVSQSTKKDLVGWNIPPKNITVIENGITKPLLKVLPKKEIKKTVIYLGALAKDKGIEEALDVFSRLNKSYDDYQFWIVGKADSAYLKGLRTKCKILSIEQNVKFWGFVNEQKKFELLSRAHVLLNPSIREGWGLVNIEANSVGTPVVAFDVPGCCDSVKNGKTGFLVKAGDNEALSGSLIKLLKEKKVYEVFRKNSIDWANNFSWEKSGKKSLQLIKSLSTKRD